MTGTAMFDNDEGTLSGHQFPVHMQALNIGGVKHLLQLKILKLDHVEKLTNTCCKTVEI